MGIYISSSAQVTEDNAKKKYVIAKGTKIMTGSVAGSYIKKDNDFDALKRSGNISLTEQNGYFVANNLSVGSLVSYSFSYNKYVGEYMTPSGPLVRRLFNHTIAPGIFVRYYKMFTPRLGLMGQFNAACLIGFGEVWSNDPVFTTRDQYLGVDVNISPRLVYFITPKLGLEAGFGSIGYNFLQDMNSGKNTHGGGFALNPDLNLGLSFYLGKGVQAK